MKKFLFVIALLLISLGAGGFWAFSQIQQSLNQPIQHKENQFFTLERGTSSKKLAEQFAQRLQASQTQWLPWALKLYPQYANVKAGTYDLQNAQTVADVLQILNQGKEVQLSIRFGEGETWRQVKKSLENTPHFKRELDYQVADSNKQVFDYFEKTLPALRAFHSQPNMDGWIYPDTYYYSPNSSDKELLKRAVEKMVKTLDKAWAQRDPDLPLQSPYEMLILASIVEKESGVQAERGKIASVFINRLKLKMKLQTDPTVIYGMGENYNGNIRRQDLETATPYNTYVIDGLPPTPIANPSESALMAVAKPEKTEFLYFVADGTGGHKFSRNLNEHNRAVQAYLRWYKENNKKN